MKKLTGLFVLIVSFTFLAATATIAQTSSVRNSTLCAFKLKVSYGDVATCTSNGTLTVIVPAMTHMVLPISSGQGILASKGSSVGSSCLYYVSSTTCPYSYGPTDSVACGSLCGSYTVDLMDEFTLWLHN